MTVAEPLRVAVIGVGQMGAYHVENWEKIDAAHLVAVADPDELAARRTLGRRPADWTADYQEVIERDDVEAVTICSPTELHSEIALAAIAGGKHLLVEKPIAATMPDALRMATAAREAGVKLMVGHVERFNPAVGKVHSLLRDGRLGEVFRAQAIRVGPLPQRVKDAGVAIDLATHDLDIMQHVLEANLTRVYAEGKRFSHATQEDMLACLLRFGDDGPFGLLDVNWLTPEKKRELTVLGEGGMLRADYLTQDVWFVESPGQLTEWDELARVRGEAEGTVVRFALRKTEPLRAELEAFVTCIREDTPEPVNAWEGARALASALAIRESANSRRPIDLLEMPSAPPAQEKTV